MSNSQNEPLQNLSYVKSNEMISAKYKSSLLENQVMAIALTRIEVNAKDKDHPLEAKLYPGELKRVVSDSAHIYRDLKTLSQTITGHTMFIEDGKGNFKAFSVVPNAEYKDGVFTVKFNNELRDHILGLEKNYTTLELSVMTDFTKNSSFRIYELLKRDMYKIKTNNPEDYIELEYDLFEFRFMIGIANSDDQAIKNKLAALGNKNVNWEDMYNMLIKNGNKKDAKFRDTDKLKKDCINVAQAELEEKSDIRFEYELIRIGKPYKKIRFKVYRNTPKNTSVLEIRENYISEMSKPFRQTELPMDQYPELYNEYVGHNGLIPEDITLLLMKANYNPDVVAKAIDLADQQEHIVSYMGWIISCIEGEYNRIETLNGSAEAAKQVREIIDVAESKTADEKEEMAKRHWERIITKDNFNDFLAELYVPNAELAKALYSYTELSEMYGRFISNKPVLEDM